VLLVLHVAGRDRARCPTRDAAATSRQRCRTSESGPRRAPCLARRGTRPRQVCVSGPAGTGRAASPCGRRGRQDERPAGPGNGQRPAGGEAPGAPGASADRPAGRGRDGRPRVLSRAVGCCVAPRSYWGPVWIYRSADRFLRVSGFGVRCRVDSQKPGRGAGSWCGSGVGTKAVCAVSRRRRSSSLCPASPSGPCGRRGQTRTASLPTTTRCS
jgi:hypothetical protein